MLFIFSFFLKESASNTLSSLIIYINNFEYIYPLDAKSSKQLSISVSPGLSIIAKFSVPLIVYRFNPIVELSWPEFVSHSLNILFIKFDFPDFFFPNTPIINSSSYKNN